VAAVALYPAAISPVVQAVVAEAGPVTAQQKFGRIVPTLPPVANWTKGCSLAGGPKVGIPLTVHGAALEVQQVAASVQFCASAATARILGSTTTTTSSSAAGNDAQTTSSRIACPFRLRAWDWSNPNRAISNASLVVRAAAVVETKTCPSCT
jgi:hypothetical protein